MKRFFCTICKRAVRVHRLPSKVFVTPTDVLAQGVCRHHPEDQRQKTLGALARTYGAQERGPGDPIGGPGRVQRPLHGENAPGGRA